MLKDHLEELVKVLDIDDDFITRVAKNITYVLKNGKKLLICGNGGSCAEAQHMATEFVGRYRKNRKGYPAIALSSSTDLTALSNDYGVDNIFARQVEALGNKGDCLIVFSTSGNSQNILTAIAYGKSYGLHTLAFLGKNKCYAKDFADLTFYIESDKTAIIQEAHQILVHEICEIVDKDL
jgi:D-sedoheptulose 7-phosphate isomerase